MWSYDHCITSFISVEMQVGFGNFSYIGLFSLITISMNLFNQLAIVICDPVMEG